MSDTNDLHSLPDTRVTVDHVRAGSDPASTDRW
jgi:hypothetical protein